MEVVAANRFFDRPTAATPAIRAAFLAHAVMWRTEMGRNPGGVGPRATEMYRAIARDWHPLLVDGGLLDPLGEMAVADLCTGGVPAAASLAIICAAQRDDGAVPTHPGSTATTFDDLYHSTCVAALAGTLAARARVPRQVDFADIFAS